MVSGAYLRFLADFTPNIILANSRSLFIRVEIGTLAGAELAILNLQTRVAIVVLAWRRITVPLYRVSLAGSDPKRRLNFNF